MEDRECRARAECERRDVERNRDRTLVPDEGEGDTRADRLSHEELGR